MVLHRSKLLLQFAVVLLLVASSVYAADYLPDEILVRFKSGANENAAAALHSSQKTSVMEKLEKARVHRLKLPKGLSVEQAIERYKHSPLVDYVGPNHILRLDYLPNDIYFDPFFQWGIYPGTGARHDIRASEAWDLAPSKGAGVIIAVIDTGVWAQHEDLYIAAPDNKILAGYNAVSNNTDTSDTDGHGTMVSSIAAAKTDNALGIAGVAWNAKILPIKVISGNQGLEADAAEGVYWAADHGAKVINMSIGGYVHEPVLEQAIDYAWAHGCLIVCSSGNDDLNTMHYPSAYDHALAVGGTDEEGLRWVYDDPFFGDHYGSNYGWWLDVMAPASMVTGAYIEEDWLLDMGYYTIASGTSAASPHVSGVAALIWGEHPTWTNEQVREQLIASCDDMAAGGWDIQTGFGQVNAQRALDTILAYPPNIRAMKALANGSRVTVRDLVVTSKPGWIPDRIYVAEQNKSSGILVYGASNPPTMNEGSIVDVSGTLGEVDGERAITVPTFSNVRSGNPIPAAYMASRDVGGKDFGLYQKGVDKGKGLNNLGLFIRCYGRVHYADFTHFYIDDGYGFRDGSGNTGLRVTWGGSKPPEGSLVVVKGMCSCEIPAGSSLRVRTLRVRKLDDIWPSVSP